MLSTSSQGPAIISVEQCAGSNPYFHSTVDVRVQLVRAVIIRRCTVDHTEYCTCDDILGSNIAISLCVKCVTATA